MIRPEFRDEMIGYLAADWIDEDTKLWLLRSPYIIRFSDDLELESILPS